MRRKSPGSACSLETLEPRLLLSYDFGLSHTGPLNVVRGHDTYIIVRATSASATAEDVWNSSAGCRLNDSATPARRH